MKRHFKSFNLSRLEILCSHRFLVLYLWLLFVTLFAGTLSRFFVADDFSWIRWAKDSNVATLFLNFVDAQGFFFRPIDKAVLYVEYNLFGLNPYPYYFTNLIFNFLVSVAVYFLFFLILKNKTLAFLGAIIFSFLPSHTQNLFWISTISTTLSTLFILLGLILYYFARLKKNMLLNFTAMFLFFCAVFSYENALIFIFLMFIMDLFVFGKKSAKKKGQIYFSYILGIVIILLYLTLRYFSNAAGFSGDYDYNLVKVLPNSAGNYLGYFIVLFSGEHLLHIYNLVRDSLKQYWIALSVAGIFMIAFLGGFLIEHKEKIHISQDTKLFIFGFLFTVFSLLPYLPLGNITLRYVYLASFGFILMILVVSRGALSKYPKKVSFATYGVIGVLYVLMSYFYMQSALRQWDFASNITFQTFSYFKNINTNEGTNVYMYNIPIKSGEAYIFPVGIVDMIYLSNKNITPYLTENIGTSLPLFEKDKINGMSPMIVTFDDNFKIKEVYEK